MTDEFKSALKALLNIGRKPRLELINDNTSLAGMDSLSITELCILVEEHFCVPVEFAEAKQLKTYGALCELIDLKKEAE